MCDVGLKDPIFCAILLLRGLSQTEPTDQLVFFFFSFFFFFFSCVLPTIAWLGNKQMTIDSDGFLSGALGHYFCSYELLL